MLIANRDKQKISHSFNKAANTYDHASDIQLLIGKQLIAQLCHYKTQVERVIDLGCGSGSVTAQLAHALEYKSFDAIDISSRLLSIARHKLYHYPINMYEQDYDELAGKNGRFDLVFSNMALHWSLRLEQTLLTISKSLLDSGIIAFSIPLVGTFAELNATSRNPFYSKDAVLTALTAAGFETLKHCTDLLTSYFDTRVAALKSIKAVGANYIFQKSHLGLRGKSFLNKLVNWQCLNSSSFSLTYRIGYFIAKKV